MFPIRGSCHGPGGSFVVEVLLALDFFKKFISMKRNRRKGKRRDNEGYWSSMMIEECVLVAC